MSNTKQHAILRRFDVHIRRLRLEGLEDRNIIREAENEKPLSIIQEAFSPVLQEYVTFLTEFNESIKEVNKVFNDYFQFFQENDK